MSKILLSPKSVVLERSRPLRKSASAALATGVVRSEESEAERLDEGVGAEAMIMPDSLDVVELMMAI
jgi:hypothetical protein